MLKWLGNMFGSSNVIDKITDEILNSKDEKSRILATDRLEKLSQFKVVQRILAASVMMVFIPLALSMIVCAIFGLDDELTRLLAVAQEPMIHYPIGMCFAAYWGSGTIESFKRTGKEKK
jgi:hypothetical protein